MQGDLVQILLMPWPSPLDFTLLTLVAVQAQPPDQDSKIDEERSCHDAVYSFLILRSVNIVDAFVERVDLRRRSRRRLGSWKGGYLGGRKNAGRQRGEGCRDHGNGF